MADTVLKITKEYLVANGFDGLYVDGECACRVDDLRPCMTGFFHECKPGYLGPCDCIDDHDWHIGPEKMEQ